MKDNENISDDSHKSTDKAVFKPADKLKMILWCNRHCCICDKSCGLDIEIAHIIDKSDESISDSIKSDIDNGIPVCFDCHGKIGRYREGHNIGTKLKGDELKARREQIYEKYTRHLIPPLNYRIYQDQYFIFPNVGFTIKHAGTTYPVKILVKIEIFLGVESLKYAETPNKLYCGGTWWNLNPQEGVNGWFPLDQHLSLIEKRSGEDLEVRINIKIKDFYGRIHETLSVGYVYMRDKKDWFLEPGESLHKQIIPYKLEGWGNVGLL